MQRHVGCIQCRRCGSWSSYVTQEKLLNVCADAGLSSDCILAADLPTPQDLSMVFAAATDDVMIFSNAGPGVTAAAAERLDEAIVSHGVLKNAAKDVTDCLNATCVGVNLENGVQWAVPPECCLALIVCATELAARKEASPEQVLELLGCLRWYDLLRRQQLAAYQQVYKFTMHADSHQQPVPGEVIEELLLGTLLGIFWLTDLRKPTLDLIAASDASTVFGLGASVAKMPADQLRRLRRLAEKQGDYVFLEGTPLSQLPKRLGQAHCLGLKREDFVHVFSVRKPQVTHKSARGRSFCVAAALEPSFPFTTCFQSRHHSGLSSVAWCCVQRQIVHHPELLAATGSFLGDGR